MTDLPPSATRASRLQRLIWSAGGMQAPILERCPSGEQIKATCIGTAVLLTAVVAWLSGGYALYTVFEDAFVSALFGALWAMLIFNLDRFIVASIRKVNAHGEPDGWGLAAPRLILAVLIGIVVAVPLELRLLAKPIEVELGALHQEQRQTQREAFDAEIRTLLSDKEKTEATLFQVLDRRKERGKSPEVARLREAHQAAAAAAKRAENRRRALQERLDDVALRCEKEKEGLLGLRGTGPKHRVCVQEESRLNARLSEVQTEAERTLERAKALEVDYNASFQDIDEEKTRIRGQLDELEDKRKHVESRWKIRDKELDSELKESDDFLSRYSAMRRLAEREPSADWIAFAISVLFVVIEISPVLVKMLTPPGPYDELVAENEALFRKDKRRRSDT